MIGVFLGDVDPYSMSVLSEIIERKWRKYYGLSWRRSPSKGSRQVLSNLLYKLPSPELSGSGSLSYQLLLVTKISNDEIKSFCSQFKPLPMVSVGEAVKDIPSIQIDNRSGLHSLMEHLILDHRYRRIACIQGSTQ